MTIQAFRPQYYQTQSSRPSSYEVTIPRPGIVQQQNYRPGVYQVQSYQIGNPKFGFGAGYSQVPSAQLANTPTALNPIYQPDGPWGTAPNYYQIGVNRPTSYEQTIPRPGNYQTQNYSPPSYN